MDGYSAFLSQPEWKTLGFMGHWVRTQNGLCSVQFSSVTQSCPTLCKPMDCSTLGLPVHHPTPRAWSNSCSSSQGCHPNISSSVIPYFSSLQSFPSLRVFSNESVLRIRWPKFWSFSFSISSSNEYSGVISFSIG